MALFVGHLASGVDNRMLEDIFSRYGRIERCDVKRGYGFVVFSDKRDADAALKENGATVRGSSIIVEYAKGERKPRYGPDECFNCGSTGHFARDCPEGGRGRDRGRRDFRGGRDDYRDRDRGGRRDSYRRRSYSRSPSPRRNNDRRRERDISPQGNRSPRD